MAAPDLIVPKAETISLFLDVDGTLIDLAPTPDAVVVSGALLDELSLAESRYSPLEPTRSLTKDRLSERAWADLQNLLEGFPGAFAENKGVSFAVHYNLAGPIEGELFLA